MVLQPDQERVRCLLTDTITLLCKNGLSYKAEFRISGVIGITLDHNDVFLVDIRETIKQDVADDNDSDVSLEEIVQTHQKKRRKDKQSDSLFEGGPLNAIEIHDTNFHEELLSMVKSENSEMDSSSTSLTIKNDPDKITATQSLKNDSLGIIQPFSQVIGSPFAGSYSVYQNEDASQANILNQVDKIKYHSIAPRLQSSPAKTYKCTICDQTMSTSNGLRYHMNRHKGIFPYYCPYCNKGQPGTTDLKNHLASVHTNGTPAYLCVYCNHTASSPSLLKSHLDGCESAKTGISSKSESLTSTSTNLFPSMSSGTNAQDTENLLNT